LKKHQQNNNNGEGKEGQRNNNEVVVQKNNAQNLKEREKIKEPYTSQSQSKFTIHFSHLIKFQQQTCK
jgi:hypothetical protein